MRVAGPWSASTTAPGPPCSRSSTSYRNGWPPQSAARVRSPLRRGVTVAVIPFVSGYRVPSKRAPAMMIGRCGGGERDRDVHDRGLDALAAEGEDEVAAAVGGHGGQLAVRRGDAVRLAAVRTEAHHHVARRRDDADRRGHVAGAVGAEADGAVLPRWVVLGIQLEAGQDDGGGLPGGGGRPGRGRRRTEPTAPGRPAPTARPRRTGTRSAARSAGASAWGCRWPRRPGWARRRRPLPRRGGSSRGSPRPPGR